MVERKPSTVENELKKKNVSQSTLRRNTRRREEFLKKKTHDDPEEEARKQSDMESNLKETHENPITVKCDRCGKTSGLKSC